MLGAAVAWATTTPPARGGHAVTVIPAATRPAPVAIQAPVMPEPVPGALAGPTTIAPIIAAPAGIATPSFTVVQTGNTVTLDASASACNNGGCDFSWRLYEDGGTTLARRWASAPS
jgi:hypothetical protein